MKAKILLLSALACTSAFASVITQVAPTDMSSLNAYVSSTTYIDFSALTDLDFYTFQPTYTSISDGNLTLTFDIDAAKFSAPDFFGWNVAPYSQRPDDGTYLPVLDAFFNSMTITFSKPVWTFGFEAEPGSSSSATISALFAGPGGNLNVSYSGLGFYQDSRIFAATGAPMTSVTITTDDWNFGVGAFRYSLAESSVPEPTTSVLIGAGLLALGFAFRRRLTA